MKMMEAHFQAGGVMEALLDLGRDVWTVLASVLSRVETRGGYLKSHMLRFCSLDYPKRSSAHEVEY